MPRRSKSKGSAFEREVCKKLSLWVSHGRHVDLFWRSAMSGGRATVAAGAVRQAGDICSVSPEGHKLVVDWYIECKAYHRVNLEQFIVNNNGKLRAWWTRCRKEARSYDRMPMLIVKQNHWPILVLTQIGKLDFYAVPIARLDGHNVDVHVLDEVIARKFYAYK